MAGVTLAGKKIKLRINGISQSTLPVAIFKDQWKSEAYSKKAKVFGTFRKWTLKCSESNTPWEECIAKHLEDNMDTNETVKLVIDRAPMHSVTETNVYIIGLEINYKESKTTSHFEREFDVSLQEGPA